MLLIYNLPPLSCLILHKASHRHRASIEAFKAISYSFATYNMLKTRVATLPRACARSFSTTPRSLVARMTIVGRLGTEPELVSTQSGGEIVRYVVGTNHGVGDNQTTSWWRVASFAEEGSPIRKKLMELPKG